MYTCSRCHHTFTKRAAYESHQARIRPCVPVIPPVVPPVALPLSTQESVMKPFLKWVGGKTQILDEILSRFPTSMTHYHEPFLGGGSVLLGVLSKQKQGTLTITGTVYASDINPILIGLYQTLQREPDQLIHEMRRIMVAFSECRTEAVNRVPSTEQEALGNRESYYYWVRSQFNRMSAEEKVSPRGSAAMLFLNKTCFRGVYREGPRGFNVPYGNNKNPGIMDEAHLRAISELIQHVVFRAQPFQTSLSSIQPSDFAYLDPPYAPETNTSFVSYTASGFNKDNHRVLFERCHELHAQQVRWMMSNADVTQVREAFPPPYDTMVVSCRRAIHSRQPDAKTNEVMITTPH
jgi:DNA adenine methylase